MKLNELTYMFALGGMLLIAACGRNELPSTPSSDEATIGFSTSVNGSRADADFVDNEAFMNAGKFILYSSYDNNHDGKFIPEFQDQTITRDKGSKKWTYEPKKYWRGTGVYHFRAYFPDYAEALVHSTGERLAIKYSIYTDKYDLMVAHHKRDVDAEKLKGLDTSRPVPLVFNHALCAIRLRIESPDTEMMLYDIYAMNLCTVGQLNYDCEDDALLHQDWVLIEPDRANKLYEYVAKENETIGPGKPFVSQKLLALPQGIDENAEYAPKLCFTLGVKDNDNSIDKVFTEKILPSTTWEAGRIYTYVLNVKPDKTTDITVQIEPWEEINANGGDIII